jgi:hypothetical protein
MTDPAIIEGRRKAHATQAGEIPHVDLVSLLMPALD